MLVIIELIIMAIFNPIDLIVNYKYQYIQLSKLYISFLLIPMPIS